VTGTLLGIAQIAVSIAGFAAIVEVVRRDGAGGWERDTFNGMVFHALVALGFSLAPIALEELALASAPTWRVLCGALGALIAVHAPLVAFVYERPGPALRALLAIPFAIGLAVLATALGALPLPVRGAYLAALCLQLVQAGVLFLRLVYQRRA
jgi:hypothetical protein